MSEIPPSEPGPANPTPPPSGPAPFDYGKATSADPYLGPPPDQDARTMGMLAHLLGIFTLWLGPLVIWLIKRETSPFVNDQGKESLNWQITVFIGLFALTIITIALSIMHILFFIGCFFGLIRLGILVVNLIFAIQGAIAANNGIAYRYPFSLRLIK
jgi:uncharacterized Tic20 family protein